MIYDETIFNLQCFFTSVGYATEPQVLRFFRDAPDSQNLLLYIKRLTESRFLDRAERTGILSYHSTYPLKPQEISIRLKALWVIVSMGSENVRQILTMAYPAQFAFIEADNTPYDVAYIPNISTAQMAKVQRERLAIANVPDCINHIALVPDYKTGEQLKPYGFDSFCVLDADYKPVYYGWEE